jgi:hypothetical protein
MGNTAFFRNHLRVIEEQSESWKQAHEEVMQNHERCDSLTEVVAMLMFLYERIAGLMQIPSGRKYTVSTAKVITAVLPVWFKAASFLLDDVDECERAGFPVDRSADLRSVHQQLGTQISGVNRLAASIQQFERGEYRAMDEVFNGLSGPAKP